MNEGEKGDRTEYLEGEWYDYTEIYIDKVVVYDTLTEALLSDIEEEE